MIHDNGNEYDGNGNLVEARPLDRLAKAISDAYTRGWDDGYEEGYIARGEAGV